MCEICHSIPCHPKCPNAIEPSVIEVCCGCGMEILAGEYYYDIHGEPWCNDCVRRAWRMAELEDDMSDNSGEYL